MTTCVVKKEKEEAVLEIKGHSGYANYGEDVVCASISTACIMSANLIHKLNLGYNILDLDMKDGYFKIKVNIVDETVCGIIDNLIETLNELSIQYPKHLKLKN